MTPSSKVLPNMVQMNPLTISTAKTETNVERSQFKFGLWAIYFVTFVTWLNLNTSSFHYVFATTKQRLDDAYSVTCGFYGGGIAGNAPMKPIYTAH